METGASSLRDQVIERIYSAAGGLSLWDEALAQLSTYCGAKASYINLISDTDSSPSLVGAFGHAPWLIERYRNYGYLFDPTTTQILAHTGQPISFSDLSRRELGPPEFHREFVASRGTDQVLAIGMKSEIGTLLVKLSRDTSSRPFTDDSSERLGGVADHVRQAVVIDRTLRRRMETDHFASAMADRLRAAVLRIDERLQVTFANQAAYQMAREGSVLSMADGRLRLADHAKMEAVRGFVRKAASAGKGWSETVRLPGGAQGGGIRIWAWSAVHEQSRGIGLVVLPDDYDVTSLEAMLHENYGLTRSETRTAVGLLAHSGLAAVAEHTGVSLETVRFHLKRIFSKTGTRRQSELVRVIANDLCCIHPGLQSPGGGRSD